MKAEEHIEEYLNDQLASEEKKLFEQAMVNDPRLQKMVENYSDLQEIGDGILEHQLLSEVKAVQHSATKTDDIIVEKSNLNKKLTIAFICLAAILGAYLISQMMTGSANKTREKERLWASYYERPVDNDLVRSTKVIDMTLFEQAKFQFTLNEFDKSRKLWQKIIDTTSNKDTINTAHFYLGHIYLNQENYEAAEKSMKLSEHANADYFIRLAKVLSGKIDESELED